MRIAGHDPAPGFGIAGAASDLTAGSLAPESGSWGETPPGAGGTPVLLLSGFQRLCTQNQLAGSRRTAVSKARFTSPMIAALERGRPFSWIGISGPASIRQRARPTREQMPVSKAQW